MSYYSLPLTALRAFEAAARHTSYSRAAEELGLTHGAVSHHIKALEALLGVTLFQRKGGRMIPTEHGQRLAVHAVEGFDNLARGVDEVKARSPRSRTVTISVLAAFAAKWLIPRLSQFHERHPDISISLRSSHMLADFSQDGIDLALRYGPGQWPGLTAELLAEEELFPVCSPRFRSEHNLSKPQDLLKVTLLRDQRLPWALWFRAAGLSDATEPNHGAAYSDAALLLQAAATDHGVALARSLLANDDLAAGRLERLFDISVPASFSYYVVFPSGRDLRAPAEAFRAWLMQQAERPA
jgi:LysR family glycine cleavage system transcriptional activator